MSIRNLILAGLLGLITACSNSDLTDLPTSTARGSQTTDVDQYRYLIGPGDSLEIFVWGNPEISGSFIVRPDGMITTRLVEDIKASGKTPTELARTFEQHLREYIREPIVSVMLERFIGPYQEQVRIIGEASEPKAIAYRQNMTLLDVMIAVNGLTIFADGDNASVIRVEEGKQKAYRLKIDSLIRDGDIAANVDILPGDIIIIPEAWF
ncbi:polysaccharide export protein [Parasalinivibrio latis]|uniref:XrtA/PEP-CTERM system exopolysaccharide export protein n=1 Tax=Parasalinivibrio latis TaxID=2952610 RepID=UPI0030E1F7C3